MHTQLAAIADELRAAQAHLHRLADTVAEDRWSKRTDPDRWSVAECVEHLNITSRVYLPILDDGIARARAHAGVAPARYRRDPLGWLLWRTMGPPARMRTKTKAAFVPSAGVPRDDLITEFDRLQGELLRRTASADGLPLQAVRVRSPFEARVQYNLYSCLTLLAPHQERHLWQAEQVLAAR